MNSTIAGTSYVVIRDDALNAAIELDNLSLGCQEAPLTAVSKVADHLAEIFTDKVLDIYTLLIAQEVLSGFGLLSKDEKNYARLLEVVAEIQISLRGIAVDPKTARRAPTILNNLRDLCLEFSRTFSNNAGSLRT